MKALRSHDGLNREFYHCSVFFYDIMICYVVQEKNICFWYRVRSQSWRPEDRDGSVGSNRLVLVLIFQQWTLFSEKAGAGAGELRFDNNVWVEESKSLDLKLTINILLQANHFSFSETYSDTRQHVVVGELVTKFPLCEGRRYYFVFATSVSSSNGTILALRNWQKFPSVN